MKYSEMLKIVKKMIDKENEYSADLQELAIVMFICLYMFLYDLMM